MNEDERSDQQLLEAHAMGDTEAFAVLVGRHKDRLWAVALRTMRNPEDAADALQEALISAFRSAHQFRGQSQVTTWLHRIVVNACLGRLRRNKVRAASPLPDDPDRTMPMPSAETPDDAVLRAELNARVETALGQINPEQRAALVLVDMAGYSVAEAAVMLGCAPGTIKSRCSRGRARLAPLLADVKVPA